MHIYIHAYTSIHAYILYIHNIHIPTHQRTQTHNIQRKRIIDYVRVMKLVNGSRHVDKQIIDALVIV